jgi:hypothetical protein
MRSLLREPLLHFAVLGAALFLYFQHTGGVTRDAASQIVITAGQLEHLAAGFARTWQRAPDDTEMRGLIDDHLREELAVREALANGLDRADSIIRRRLRQKLEFLAEDVVRSTPPTEQELQAWLDARAEVYRGEPLLSLRQVYLSRQRSGGTAQATARGLLEALRARGAAAQIDDLGDASMLPQELARESRSSIGTQFGDEFAARIDTLAPGVWSEPVESSYGLHLVLVRERIEGALPELSAVRARVERDLLDERRTRQLAAMYARLLTRYDVVIERPAETARSLASGS